jgi:Abnormal spindle-like microcephaly-assoc'd, ASPM-SPD-2-Hydin
MTPLRNWQGAAIAILTTAVLLLSGCNLFPSGGSSNSGTGKDAAGQVVLNSSSLSFGNVTVGSSKSLQITLTNSSASDGPTITVSKVTATGTGFSNNTALPVELSPGKSVSLNVKFAPPSTGTKSGSLAIDVVGASDPGAVTLKGAGVSNAVGSLSVSPSTLSFGTVNVGNSKDMNGTLTAGSADVKISSASWAGSGYSVSGITFPVTVKSGQNISFTVTFAPPAAGSSSGNISFLSDAGNSPTKATLSGTGNQPNKQHIVSLSWSPSSSPVVGYNVYRGTQSGGPYTRLNSSPQPSTSYNDGTVVSGRTYFYAATAVNSSSAESGYSAEVVAVVPTP